MNSVLSQNTSKSRDGPPRGLEERGERIKYYRGGKGGGGWGGTTVLKHLTRCQTETVNTVSAAEVDGKKKLQ